jgi:hypothetical protein
VGNLQAEGDALRDTGRLRNPRKRMLRKPALLLCLVALTGVLHAAFRIEGCGEQDAARLLNAAAIWHQQGLPPNAGYTIRVSPLYLHALKKCLDWGVPLRVLPDLVNWLNVLSGSLLLVPLFLLWEDLLGPGAAAGAVGLFAVMPAFWYSCIYGMPHIPSFGLFVLCLLLFHRWTRRSDRRSLFLWAWAAFCMTVALSLKADMVLCSGALIGILRLTNRLSIRNAAYALAIPCIALLGTLVYTRLLVHLPQSSSQFAVAWRQHYPVTLSVFGNQREMSVLVQTAGRVLFLAIAGAALYCAFAARRRRLLAFAALWAAPAILFWALRYGNSARHMMAPFCALIALVPVFIFDAVGNPRRAAAALVLLFSLNYIAEGRSASTVTPSSRIFEAPADIQNVVSRLHNEGKQCYEMKGDRKLLVAPSRHIPYIIHEVTCGASDFQWLSEDSLLRIVGRDGREQLIRIGPPEGESAHSMEQKGWTLCISEPEA